MKTFILILFSAHLTTLFAAPVTPFKDGEVKLLEFSIPSVAEQEISLLRVKVFNLGFPVFKGIKNGRYFSLITSPLGVLHGDYDLQLLNGEKVIDEQKVSLVNRDRIETEEILDAPEINVLPKEKKLVEQIATEDLEQRNTLVMKSPERLWRKDFIRPVSAKINSGFGLYRVYSKHLRRRTHWGVDFHTPIGTPVKASGDGVVQVAKSYYFPGKTVLLDHGQGLFTGYSHLKKIIVKPGEKVKQGQIIGLSGVSGKVTGPHLHWFAVNGRVKFDPMTLLNVAIDE